MDFNQLSDDEKRIIKKLLEKENETKRKDVKVTSSKLLEKSHRRQDFHQFQILSNQAVSNNYLLKALVILIFFPFLHLFFINLGIVIPSKVNVTAIFLIISFSIFFIAKSILLKMQVKRMKDTLKKVIYKVQ